MTSTCEIDPELVEKINQFRFAKYKSGNAAFVLQIDRKTLKIVEEEVYENTPIEELVEELPENTPRFVILSYELKYSDGRVNFPLLFIYWSPSTAKAEINMLYASAKTYLQEKIGVNRGFDIRDAETLTDEFLTKQLL
ncbi:Glia maturation factor gamma [Choanephora cucurbitarum]|uniref:Glia maturation factor gamma n=1 Tax=Choanephora cucurbitarum TaxID=101091 RepID=A0A1C7NKB0_9FUNG|nr:Glia maturation factor gamma [Choanephora cucurbitarum]